MSTADDVAELTRRLVDFVSGIGLSIAPEPGADGLLPAMAVRDGTLFYDPDRLRWPGDLLHEAGHLAVTDPALRRTISTFDDDGGDEMTAIAWSYAAALAVGIDPRLVFHDDGYKGDGAWLAETFAGGSYIGLPMLQYYGLAARAGDGAPPYPAMKRWLR